MDTTQLLLLVTGVHTGILLCGIIAFVSAGRRGKEPSRPHNVPVFSVGDHRGGKDDRRSSGGPLDVALAMGNLCQAADKLAPGWQGIEIVRQGENMAAMKITGPDGQEIDPSKMH